MASSPGITISPWLSILDDGSADGAGLGIPSLLLLQSPALSLPEPAAPSPGCQRPEPARRSEQRVRELGYVL